MELLTEIEIMKNEMKNIKKTVDEGFILNTKQHKELVVLFQKAIDKKAGKWVEKVMIATLSSIGLILVGALMAQVIIE